MIHLFEKGFKYVASFLYQHVIQTIESEDYHQVAENYIYVFFGYGLFEPTLKKNNCCQALVFGPVIQGTNSEGS